MQLETYLQDNDITLSRFAETIGVANAKVVQRYVKGERTPIRDIMARIVAATGGAVTPNDFFDAAGGEAE